MRIAVNLLSSRSGSGLALNRHFLPALAAHDESNEYCVILGEEQYELSSVIPERFEKRIIRSWARSHAGTVLWEQLVLPFYLRRWEIDVLYSLGNKTTLLAGCNAVVVVTNATPFSHLRLKRSLEERARLFFLRRVSVLSAKKARKLIFISKNSRDLICQRLSLPLNKAEVIYYGWTPFQLDADGPPPDMREYVLTVSILWPYKNIERLMKAFDLMVQRHGFAGSLVVAGAVGSKTYHERLLRLRETLTWGDRIVFTGRLKSKEIASLYKQARLFVLPSVEETLGLPLQEAMGYGVPVATADCRLEHGADHCFNPFREICGEAADYFNPFDETSICESMHRVLSDSKYRDGLVSCGLERVKRFSWDLMAKQTIAVFETLKQA